MKTWKKVVLWVFAIVLLVVAIGSAFVAGVYKEAMWTARDHARYDIACHGAHYLALKEIETEELAQTRQWRQVTGNLQIMVYNAVQFIDEHPGYFVYEGRSKESFDRSLERARKIGYSRILVGAWKGRGLEEARIRLMEGPACGSLCGHGPQ